MNAIPLINNAPRPNINVGSIGNPAFNPVAAGAKLGGSIGGNVMRQNPASMPVNNETQLRQEVNTSIVALKREAFSLENLIAQAAQTLQDINKRLSELEGKQGDYVKKNDVVDSITSGNMNPVTSNAVATSNAMPVNSVTSGNMHSVTSNAVAISLKEKLNKEYWTLFSDWAPVSEQVMNTYINRKFSDYNILIFVIGANNVNIRNTIILPREVFANTNESVYIFAHGSNQIVEVDIRYNDDTSIKIQQDVASGNPFTPYIRIYGI